MEREQKREVVVREVAAARGLNAEAVNDETLVYADLSIVERTLLKGKILQGTKSSGWASGNMQQLTVGQLVSKL